MRVGDSWRKLTSSDLAVLVLWATAGVLLHTVTNGQYGFHRDELATLDDARSLAWGYVAYPPLTPFLARIAFILFGPSLIGLRFFAAVALGLVLVLTGLMARHMGGGRQAQIVAALAAAIGGVAFSAGTLFQYVSFDYLWWVAAAYFMVRLLASDDPRWCLAVGAAIGLGMLTKYTMMFLAVGIAAGFLFTPARRYLRSPWLWCGVALAFVIFLPNLHLADPASFRLVGLLEEHSRSRHPHRTNRRIRARPVLDRDEPSHCPIVAGWPLLSVRHPGWQAVSPDWVDVHYPLRAVRDRKRSGILHGPGLSHVARCRGGMGRAVGCFVEFAARPRNPKDYLGGSCNWGPGRCRDCSADCTARIIVVAVR